MKINFLYFLIVLNFSLDATSVTLYKYRIYCIDEGENVYIWKESTDSTPTTCPNDTAHSINTQSISIVDLQAPNEVTLNEEWAPTGGYFRAETLTLDIDAGPDIETTLYFSWPIDITLMEVVFHVKDNSVGDSVTVDAPFDIVVGAITQNVSANDTTIHVDATTIANVAQGLYLTLDDGSNLNDLGRIISLDKANSTVTVETAATNNYSALSPTYIKITATPIKNFVFDKADMYRIGQSVLRGSPIPAHRLIRVKYLNKDSSAKMIHVPIEYQY